jgi:phospho-N-acetylmuramoyl-pentapeptide-transferase
MATALVISFVLGPWIIERLRVLRVGQVVREEGPSEHLVKAGTPTMGGVLILVATVTTLLWADLTAANVIIATVVLLWTGALGFLDDYLKVVRKRTEGLVARYKLVGQGLIGLLVAVAILTFSPSWSTPPGP